jgi:hypothetical protein
MDTAMTTARTPKPGRSLVEARPELVTQWHPTLNGDLTLNQVSACTDKKLWWKCDAGPDHEWQSTGANRVYGQDCPFCARQKVSVTNSMAVTHPELAVQWHPTLNGDLTPNQVIAGTRKKLWWKCDAGPDHEWQTRGTNRACGNGCPFCARKKVSVTNSMAVTHPHLAAQLHPTLNGDLTSNQVLAGTGTTLWWKCAAGPDHEWQATGAERVKGRCCPFCTRRRASTTNSMAVTHPELAVQWHPTLNGDLTPGQVTVKTRKKLWWKCDAGPDHEWQSRGDHRMKGRGCPFCARRKVSVTNSVAATHPQLVTLWHPTLNGDLTADQVVAGTRTNLWWKCVADPDHEWRTRGDEMASSDGCPFCA